MHTQRILPVELADLCIVYSVLLPAVGHSWMSHQVSMTSCAISDVYNTASSRIYKPSNTHDQSMYTIQVYMGNIQAANWHNVATARYHGLERRRGSYGAGVCRMGPTEATFQVPRSYWTRRTWSWPLINFLHSSSIHLDI